MNLKASVIGSQVKLRFTAVTGAATYRIYVAYGTRLVFNVLISGLTSFAYTHTPTSNNTLFYKYAAVNSGGTEISISDVSVVSFDNYDVTQELKALIYGMLISNGGVTGYIAADRIYSQYPTIPEQDPSITFGVSDSSAIQNWQTHESKRITFLILANDTGILDRIRNVIKKLFSDFAYRGTNTAIERMICVGDDGETLAIKDYVVMATRLTFTAILNTDYTIEIPN